MSWVSENKLSWPSLFFLRILKCGQIPKHVAFIMDGNRRFAKKINKEKVEGHTKGFDKLSETLQWCLEIGVKEVTVYAFSIENYKRTQEEVDALMNLTREKFRRLLDEKQKLKEIGLKIRVVGNRTLLPEDIVELIKQAEELTKENTSSLLNVAFSYSAQDEMTNAMNVALRGLHEGNVDEGDLNLNLLSHCLYTGDSPPPELLIRTSGETRLSDFLLWQGSCSYLHFTGVLWPELSAWDFLWAIFKYQRVSENLENTRKILQSKDSSLSVKSAEFINNVHFGALKTAFV